MCVAMWVHIRVHVGMHICACAHGEQLSNLRVFPQVIPTFPLETVFLNGL